MVFEYFRVTLEDKFEALKDPRKFFFETININDATTYIRKLLQDFRNDHQLTTRKLLLEDYEVDAHKSSFELETDDGLFEQHYFQVPNY